MMIQYAWKNGAIKYNQSICVIANNPNTHANALNLHEAHTFQNKLTPLLCENIFS